MKHLLILISLLLLPAGAEATIYYAAPAGSGAASCVDTGANVCTLTRAEAVATNGDTVTAACGTYDLGASTLTVNVNITIAPVTDGCAIITGTNATSIVTLTAANDANVLTFGAFDVQTTGGATWFTVTISNVAYDQVVVLSGTTISVAGIYRHISDEWTRGTVKLLNVSLTGTLGSQAGFYSIVTPASAKKLLISGCTFTLIASASNTPGIYIERAAGNAVSEWVSVTGNTITLTVPPALGASAYGIGIRLNRITRGTNLDGLLTSPIVELNTVSITATGATSSTVTAIMTGSSDATAVADGTVIRNNVIAMNAPATFGISGSGPDSTTANFADGVRIYGNVVTNVFYNGVATPHGIQCGRQSNCTITGNHVYGFAVGYLSSISTDAIITGNISEGAFLVPFYAKGNTSATFANNTAIMDDALYGARISTYGCMGVAVQGATNNAATTFQNNNCYVRSGTGWKHVVVDNSQVAAFDANNYYSIPTLTTPWSYQSTTYATVGLWNAAATVGTDLNVDPLFLSATDYRLALTSPLRRTGIWWSNACSDLRGYPCFPGQINIGAYQDGSGDYAATRTAR